MQIILLEKIANVGNLGDIVKVKDGFARTFLILQGKAKRATDANVKLLESKRAELEAAAQTKVEAAQALAAKIEGLVVKITQKAGVDGRLFGSVTNVDIVDALKAQGIAIEKAMIRMPAGPLKLVGDYPLVIAPHHDVVANITVSVLGDTVQGG
jgi:large subunit ribosomal protein L9